MYNLLSPGKIGRRERPDVRSLQIPRGEVLAEKVAVKVFPGRMLYQLRGGETAAVLPDILPQPIEEGGKVTVGDIAF